MEDGAAHAEIEAEDHPVLADHPDHAARSVNARSVSRPITTWLAPQASTSKVLSGVCAPASTMMAPAKPVSSCASSRSMLRCTAPPWIASRSAM